MLKKLLLKITANRPARIIYVGGNPYLIRYYLGQWANRTWYLHQFLRGDSEPHLHNHPWFFSRSIVLLGAYFEERLLALCAKNGPVIETRRIGITNAIGQADFHRIVAVKPETWTLFFHTTERMHKWGFFEIQPPDGDGYQPTLFHQPLRYNAIDWWAQPVLFISRISLERARSNAGQLRGFEQAHTVKNDVYDIPLFTAPASGQRTGAHPQGKTFAGHQPTGFVAICLCGKTVGAMRLGNLEPKECGMAFGRWLSQGLTVQARFGDYWEAKVESCECGHTPHQAE